jgi:hypothetical protein
MRILTVSVISKFLSIISDQADFIQNSAEKMAAKGRHAGSLAGHEDFNFIMKRTLQIFGLIFLFMHMTHGNKDFRFIFIQSIKKPRTCTVSLLNIIYMLF